jgi:hypothetical protein
MDMTYENELSTSTVSSKTSKIPEQRAGTLITSNKHVSDDTLNRMITFIGDELSVH